MNPHARQESASLPISRYEPWVEVTITVRDIAALVREAGAAGDKAESDRPGSLGSLTSEEIEMLMYFRELPDDSMRRACVDALLGFLQL